MGETERAGRRIDSSLNFSLKRLVDLTGSEIEQLNSDLGENAFVNLCVALVRIRNVADDETPEDLTSNTNRLWSKLKCNEFDLSDVSLGDDA